MAVKRRTIWMSDEHWDELGRVVVREQRRADLGLGQKITPSLVILDALDRGHFRVLREAEGTRTATIYSRATVIQNDNGTSTVIPSLSDSRGLIEAARELGDVADEGRRVLDKYAPNSFNSRPFTPAPKKGK